MNVEVVVEASTGDRHVAHMLAQGPLSVGRGEECDVQLDDNHVSRRHVLLIAEPGTLRVQDVSTNGTLAGDQLLRGGSIDVAYGTPILLGFHTIYVRALEAPLPPPPPPTLSDPPVVLAPVVPLYPAAKTHPLPPPPAPAPAPAPPPVVSTGEADGTLRREIHKRLLEHLDLAMTDAARLDDPSFRPRVLTALRRIVKLLDERIPAGVDRDQLVGEMADEALGLGPLEHLLSDPTVSEIMVIDSDTIYVERLGKITKSAQRFTDDERVRAVIERIVTPLGRRIDESSPLVDARLPDGSRVNAIIKPLALKGSCITIRKFPKSPLNLERLYELSALSPAMGQFLTRSVLAKKNIVISGGTGSGKTTLLNVLSAFIPPGERIVTIEDSAELRLEQPHVVSLETRPPNMEGKGQYTIRDLVKNALRMRPDRIVVGECRGGEALDMLQAMNTGHDGSLTTTHANSPAEALARLETLCLMAGVDLPARAIREQIASSVQLIVQQTRLSDGSRKVVAISEVCGMDQRGDFELRRIYGFDRRGTGPNGEVLGSFLASGYLPSFLDELIVRGLIKPGERYL
ncbi:MAG: FHA domain-containing protein [Myxococcales bacterium]|nr:MAG: FHA domain-containing protein [Myxococcales bacterium]